MRQPSSEQNGHFRTLSQHLPNSCVTCKRAASSGCSCFCRFKAFASGFSTSKTAWKWRTQSTCERYYRVRKHNREIEEPFGKFRSNTVALLQFLDFPLQVYNPNNMTTSTSHCWFSSWEPHFTGGDRLWVVEALEYGQLLQSTKAMPDSRKPTTSDPNNGVMIHLLPCDITPYHICFLAAR